MGNHVQRSGYELPRLRGFWRHLSGSPSLTPVILVGILVSVCEIGAAGTVSISFASFGQSYSAALFADDPLVGLEVTGAEIHLVLEAGKGADAGTLVTDLVLPIEPGFGGSRAIVLRGSELGWAGEGSFQHTRSTDQFNGTLVAARYGGATYRDGPGEMNFEGRIDLEVPGYTPGDFNFDGEIDAEDIDYLTDQLLEGNDDWFFDITGDGRVDLADHQAWVETVAGTSYGDANLDGRFDSRDLVQVFVAGRYEDVQKQNASWAQGDWNGDADFDSQDFVIALQAGGYETSARKDGERRLATAIPEPKAAPWWCVVVATLSWRKRRT